MLKNSILAVAVFCTSAPALAKKITTLETVLQCVFQKAPDHLPNGIDLGPARVMELPETYVFVHGSLGWHTTWAVLFDVTNDGVSAYETYGADGDMPGAFGRMAVPELLRSALVECEVEWKGLWPNDWPELRSRETVPLVELTKPILKLPLNDLLPPSE